jgi:zinc transporter, ZIP family
VSSTVANVLLLVAIGAATALATGLGALPVWILRDGASGVEAALLGLAAGVMGVAAIVGLLVPGLDQGPGGSVIAGAVVGCLFLFGARRLIERSDTGRRLAVGSGGPTSLLVFGVLFVHSLPEGMAMGTAYASGTAGLGLFVILAIAIQNIPEGTAVAIPLAAAGVGRTRQFWAAVATSAPQPLAAPASYLLVEQVQSLLPFSFGFAGAAMLALVAVEMLPRAVRDGGPARALAGAACGAALMALFSLLLGV